MAFLCTSVSLFQPSGFAKILGEQILAKHRQAAFQARSGGAKTIVNSPYSHFVVGKFFFQGWFAKFFGAEILAKHRRHAAL